MSEKDRRVVCAEQKAEVRRLTELWMDAVEHLAERNSNGRVTASYPISRDVIHELKKRGLAEGNERDGWVLKRPGEGES